MKFIIPLLLVTIWCKAHSQNDSLKKLKFSAYGELYYSYDLSNPQNHEKSNFLYNHKRHNELNANLLLLKGNYLDKKFRANLGLMAGNYAQYNLATEPNWAQFVYEANIGVKVLKNQNLWIDVGIMPSHIGFESAVSAECWTLTRSLVAENSPYYETGVRVGYTSDNERWNIAALYLNGWQRIFRPNYSQTPSFGTQINYRLSNKLFLNYSTFLGTDKPDSIKAFRQFHNMYVQYLPTNQLGIIIGFDIGRDKTNLTSYCTWFAPVLIIRKGITQKTRIAFRGEYYNDSKQIIISTGTSNGFQTLGFSSNLDLDLNDIIKFRIEGKLFHSKDSIFDNENNNYSITTNMTFQL